MLPGFLVPESTTRVDGLGTEVALGATGGKNLQLTLGINRILEEESLHVSVWGSPDKEKWEELAAFPHKCYCGTYSMTLALARRPDIRYLRAKWKMHRWGRGAEDCLFRFYLFAEEALARVASGAA